MDAGLPILLAIVESHGNQTFPIPLPCGMLISTLQGKGNVFLLEIQSAKSRSDIVINRFEARAGRNEAQCVIQFLEPMSFFSSFQPRKYFRINKSE